MKILRPVYILYILLLFGISISILFPIILILSLFNAKKTIFYLMKYWVKWWLFMIGMSPTIYGNVPNGKYIYVANHISYLDSMVVFATIQNYFCPLGNKEFSSKFIIGLIYKQLTILVDRGSSESRAKSVKLLQKIIDKGTSIFIFPEGKFNTSENTMLPFYDGAFRLAINTQTPLLPMVLWDTSYRWHYRSWFSQTPGKNRVIFLDPVDVTGLTLNNTEELKQKVHSLIEEELENKFLIRE